MYDSDRVGRLLMQPHFPGEKTTDKRWREAFGKVGKYDNVEACTDDPYARRVAQLLEQQKCRAKSG